MITAKKMFELLEEYFTSKNILGKNVEVYKNPTLTDVKELNAVIVRFIADNRNRTVYIWDGYLAIHSYLWDVITGHPISSRTNCPYLFPGIALVNRNKLTISQWDEFDNFKKYYSKSSKRERVNKGTSFFPEFFSIDWSWVDKYISGTSSFIQTRKNEFNNIIK